MSLALAAIQQRPRPIGYSMPAKDYSTGADLLADVRDVHRRMRPAEVVRVKVERAAEVEPVHPIPVQFTRKPHEYMFVYRAPYKKSGARWNKVSAEYIIAEVCAKHRVTLNEIKGTTRAHKVVHARFEAYTRLSEEIGYSSTMIGRAMGGKDHSGVLHGIQKHKERAEAKL